MSIEAAVIGLGTAVVKSAVGIWLGGHEIVAGAADKAIDIAAGRISGHRDQRRFSRTMEQSADTIGARLEPFILNELRALATNERIAAVDAVTDTLSRVALTDQDLFAIDLDAGRLFRHVQQAAPDAKQRAGLSSDAAALFDLVLRESCTYVIQYRTVLPQSGVAGLVELLRRETELHKLVEQALDRLPVRRGDADFERDYRQLVANRLDQVEFFGATLSDASRRYPLSVAYLSLTVSLGSTSIDRHADAYGPSSGDTEAASPDAATRVPDVLRAHRMLFVRGEAGLGKTMLLQWVAVQSARSSFGPDLEDWNATVPFYLALRHYGSTELPPPERFIDHIGRHIADEMPHNWVHEKLRSGKGVVLVDGLDELNAKRRHEVQIWLQGLTKTFPDARYIVTSRPAAAPTDWLGWQQFAVCDLEPMTPADIREFVTRWHSAMCEQARDADEQQLLTDYQQGLILELERRHHLRRLARFPLLCALICALHRDRNANLPSSRMELYEVALQMLLERRDTERGLEPAQGMTRTAKTMVLQDIAYWLIRNGLTEAPTRRVIDRIAAILPTLSIPLSPDAVYRHILERSGLIREPAHRHTDFVHRTFQEYLAGRAAVGHDDVGVLLTNAGHAEWRETIVMAAGHANLSQRAELMSGLLDEGDQAARRREGLHLLAISCLETAPELAPELRTRVEAAAAALIPPKTATQARILAAGGPYVLDLLSNVTNPAPAEIVAIIRTVLEIGDPAGIGLLERYVGVRRKAVQEVLLAAWSAFDADEYAQRIIARLAPETVRVLSLNEPAQIAAAVRAVAETQTIELSANHIREQPEILRALSAATRPLTILSPSTGPSLTCALARSGGAALAVERSTAQANPLLVGAFLDAVFGDLSTAFEKGQTVGYTQWSSLDWPAPLGGGAGLPATGVCVSGIERLGPGVAASGAEPRYFAVFSSPHLSNIDGLLPWAPHLRAAAFVGCPKVSLRVLHHFTRCEALVVDAEADLADIAQMTALERLFLIGPGTADLSLLRKAPRLRIVHLANQAKGHRALGTSLSFQVVQRQATGNF
ncbi:NACHT domain-containing protein [Dactylosporangium sp. NPDC048998]|uniref:NACHT domain-containing protein n=1 Tax=Dactylosporangium sp. NPDC048998 TaxID=3363976 RepID=UPI003723A9E9